MGCPYARGKPGPCGVTTCGCSGVPLSLTCTMVYTQFTNAGCNPTTTASLTFTLTYNSGTHLWENTSVSVVNSFNTVGAPNPCASNYTGSVQFKCNGGTTWGIQGIGLGVSAATGAVTACSPFSWSHSGLFSFGGGTVTGTTTWTVTA